MPLQTIKNRHYTEIRLNRPEKRNALSCELMRQLIKELEAVSEDHCQRAVIFTGEGVVFCAGLDLQELADQRLAKESAALLSRLLMMIYSLPIVTICAVRGASIAGGAALMAACDLVLAEEGTRIGFPEVRRGIVAGFVSALLAKQVRIKEIKELLFLGEPVTAKRAQEMGLVTRVIAKGSLEAEKKAMVEKVLLGAPQTVRLSKALLEKLDETSLKASWTIAESFHLQSRASGEAKEGALAFLEKRKPEWVEE